MELKLPYGRNKLAINFPDNGKIDLGNTSQVIPADKPANLIEEALDSPLGPEKLEVLARRKIGRNGKIEVAIIIDDGTRACPDDILVPIILERLIYAGVKPGWVTGSLIGSPASFDRLSLPL